VRSGAVVRAKISRSATASGPRAFSHHCESLSIQPIASKSRIFDAQLALEPIPVADIVEQIERLHELDLLLVALFGECPFDTAKRGDVVGVDSYRFSRFSFEERRSRTPDFGVGLFDRVFGPLVGGGNVSFTMSIVDETTGLA